MKVSPLSTAQLGTAWLTGLALVLGAWWAFHLWETQRNANVAGNMIVVKRALKTVGERPLSNDPLAKYLDPQTMDTADLSHSLDSVERLQNETASDMLDFAQKLRVVRPAVTVFTVIVVGLLLALTWQWANARKQESSSQ